VTTGIRRVLPLVLAAALAAAGCGREERVVAPPPKVPIELVPPSLTTGGLAVSEDGQAKEAFAQLEDDALIADGRLWQIRQGERLVGTLQVSTMKTKVDLTDADQRRSIVNHILPGPKQEIEIRGLAVATSEANDKTVFVWFGRDLFELLQVKSTTIDPEAVVDELIAFQAESRAWKALPLEDEENSDEHAAG
jgi:hypothetical protein